MRTLFKLALAVFLLLSLAAHAADRVTLTITITNTPSDGNQLTVNSDTRTWKTTVASPATQIVIGASIGANATNLYNHVGANGFTGPLILLRSGTNAVQLVGQVGQALGASISGTWASLTLSTQTVQQAMSVRVPITAEPTASVQTNIASLLVSNVFNLGLSTNKILASSAVMDNFADTSENQTVAGIKTFTGANIYSNSAAIFALGSLTNATLQLVKINEATTNNGVEFWAQGVRVTTLAPDTQGQPSLYDTAASSGLTTPANFTPAAANILNRNIADFRYGQKPNNNTWTGTNTFTRITNSTVVNSTFNAGTYDGTVINLTNGTFWTPVLNSAVNVVTPFQSYVNSASNVEIGLDSAVTNTFTEAIAIGYQAKAGANQTVAIGAFSVATPDSSTALGYQATPNGQYETRLGSVWGGSGYVSAPGTFFAKRLSIGGEYPVHYTNGTANIIDRGLFSTNSSTTAASDPVGGGFLYANAGEWQYRTSGTSEGAGQVNRLHNRAQQVIGSGSAYGLTASYARVDFGGQDPEVSLPSAGTYLIHAIAEIIAGGTSNDEYDAKLYNSTDAADIASSERIVTHITLTQVGQIVLENIVTVTGAKTIQIYARNATAARGSINSIRTTITYVRLF